MWYEVHGVSIAVSRYNLANSLLWVDRPKIFTSRHEHLELDDSHSLLLCLIGTAIRWVWHWLTISLSRHAARVLVTGPLNAAGVDRLGLRIWILVLNTDCLLDVESLGMLRLHIVPKPLSVHVPDKMHRDNVRLGGALLRSTFWDVAFGGEERWPLADRKRVIPSP